jgi:hypothetical protein
MPRPVGHGGPTQLPYIPSAPASLAVPGAGYRTGGRKYSTIVTPGRYEALGAEDRVRGTGYGDRGTGTLSKRRTYGPYAESCRPARGRVETLVWYNPKDCQDDRACQHASHIASCSLEVGSRVGIHRRPLLQSASITGGETLGL